MRARGIVVPTAALVLAAGAVLMLRHHRSAIVALRQVAAPMAGEPQLMLWAWATPEDLRSLNPARVGVAFLAREVVLGQQAEVHPRLQRLVVPDGTWLLAVVRLEPSPTFRATPTLRAQAMRAVLDALAEPGVRGLQVDFDAAASQRDFYAELLREVRRAMPAGMPLSMTALVSWCSADSWLTRLPSGVVPVDEAVPMFFRMGGRAATRAGRPRTTNEIAAAVCAGSVGISTDEAWPAIGSAQRVYVFRKGPWTEQQIASANRLGYVRLRETSP